MPVDLMPDAVLLAVHTICLLGLGAYFLKKDNEFGGLLCIVLALVVLALGLSEMKGAMKPSTDAPAAATETCPACGRPLE